MICNTLEVVKKIFERYESKHKIEHYFGLLAYAALAKAAHVAKDSDLIEKCEEYFNLYPDNFEHPNYNFESYRVGGPGKAWMFLHGYMPQWEADLRKFSEITLSSPADENGILCMPCSLEPKKIWIDIAAFVTPFMLYTGVALNEDKYIDFAAELCYNLYNVFLDKTCGLLHQARGFLKNPMRVSEDHWSRGNGWGILGLSELVQYLPENSPHRKKAEEYFAEHIDALIEHQSECGLWRQEITCDLSWYEASGTGLILYAIGVGIRLGLLNGEQYRKALEKGITALSRYCLTADFATHLSCPGCLCPGEGDERGSIKAYITTKMPKTDEVHSYGCMMLAYLEAYRNGITETEVADK